MIYRKASIPDIPKIKSLWKEVFGDANDYINHFITHFGIETCFVCEINHGIVAMAFALSTDLKSSSNIEGVSGKAGRGNLYKNFPLKYIYACATHPQRQNQGIMQKLLGTIYDVSCSENVAGIFLNAADQFLASYYKKIGFEDFFYREHFWYYKERLLARKSAKSGILCFISSETYHKKRIQKLKNTYFINWNEDFFRFIHKEKMLFCEYKNTIFSFKTLFNTIIVDELLGDIPSEQIAQLLMEQFPEFETVHIRLPGNEICCGQVKWCKDWTNLPEKGYFAFAME
jgi:N-acetylglutamate synthase-like GNAT family acetyltransferase